MIPLSFDERYNRLFDCKSKFPSSKKSSKVIHECPKASIFI